MIMWIYFIVAVSIIFLDQLTKFFVLSMSTLPVHVFPFFTIDLVINRGLMSGILHSDHWLPFVFVSSLVILFLGVFTCLSLKRMYQGYSILAEVLIIAGALSNIIDRFARGGVIDFIKLHYKSYTWPVFNVADISIVIGVAVLLWYTKGNHFGPE